MAPRKRSVPSSSTKKAPDPCKFGIQHFFERHSQSQAAAAAAASSSSASFDVPKPNLNPPFPPKSNPSTASDRPPPPSAAAEADESSSPISPDISKAVPLKRFKFSPRMLINQSQDDGGDEITWKISPVNEKLRNLASKRLPRTMGVLQECSRAKDSMFHPCSIKQDLSAARLEQWLSSPTITSKRSSVSYASISVEDPEIDLYEACNDNVEKVSKITFKSPFRTPPSLPYGPKELANGAALNGEYDDSDPRGHKKALLELLDQVEDVITEEPAPGKLNLREYHMPVDAKNAVEPNLTSEILLGSPMETIHSALDYDTFLVLEVSEKHMSSNAMSSQQAFKAIRLLNERTSEEKILHLRDEWYYSVIGPGDTVNVVGEFDDQRICVVDRSKNLLIIHPDTLISGTRVASSFTCPRRAVLDERLKSVDHSSVALIGTLLHQIFQAGLVKDFPTKEFLEDSSVIVLKKNIESVYACGANEKEIHSKLVDAIPKMLNWLKCFKEEEEGEGAKVDFGLSDEQKAVKISEVIDIEEMAWAPRYGLKGMIDASVRVKINSSNAGSFETVMPLEFKTGKGTSGQTAMEHSAQVILYTLLMSERYLKSDIDAGLLYYLHTDLTRGIKVQRSDLIGLIMRRNELANDILMASRTQNLPTMLQKISFCNSCRHLNICSIYHKACGGNSETSGLGNLFDNLVDHLSPLHIKFLKYWDQLIDLEAKASQANKRDILRPDNLRRDYRKKDPSSFVLDVKSGNIGKNAARNGRYVYDFVHHGACNQDQVIENPSPNNIHCNLKCGDYVILSTESGRIAVASGVISKMSQSHLSVSFSRRLRLPGVNSASEVGKLVQQVWRIDKDEVSSTFTIVRFNLTQLFAQSTQSTHLRKMVVDLEPPRFDSGGMFSQDPAISYVRSQNNLNDDQRRSIRKILSAKDYTLILGMPGTGKTSTIVHAVKALLFRGASILLTSYTNSAIDNLLIKLKCQGVDFVRIGRYEAVHNDIREHCFPETVNSVDDIKARFEDVKVVGVTCLGVHHPLLANKKFDICIMDEAGQITLPVSLGPLTLASTFVLVGDHYQLPPLVQSTEARENGMSISLFCRLSEAHPQAISALQCQYRMCASIMGLSNALIYGNRLRCGSSEIAEAKLNLSIVEPTALWLKQILDPNRPVIFVNTDNWPANEERDNKTVNNPLEAHIVSEITGELVRRGLSREDIGVITPYNSQAHLIQCVSDGSIEVQTIDKYQGRDKDCIIVSFVRSVENNRTCTSSLLGDWHRINVALTRAKKKLIMVGSCKTLSRVPLLKLLIEKVNEQNGIVLVSKNDVLWSDKSTLLRAKARKAAVRFLESP